MESDARPPEKLLNDGPMDRNWNRWKHEFLIYMKLTGGINKPEDEKAAWLKNLIGPVGREALEKISFDNPDDSENMTIIMQKLEEHFDPPKSEILERNKFFLKSKKNNESIDAYVENLKAMAKRCNFGEQTEYLVRDAVILDIKDKYLRKLLFEKKDLDLESLKTIYKNYEIKTAKMKDISKETAAPEEGKFVPKKFFEKKSVPSAPSSTSEPKNPCSKCGERHPMRACPAFGNTCCYCKQLNHFWYRCPVAKEKGVEMLTVNDTASYVKGDNLKTDPLVNNFEVVERGIPKKVQNEFSTLNYEGMQQSNPYVQHPQPSPVYNWEALKGQSITSTKPSTASGENSNDKKPSNYNNSSTKFIQKKQSKQMKEKDSECVIS